MEESGQFYVLSKLSLGKEMQHPLDRRLDEPESWLGCSREKNDRCPVTNQIPLAS
jgi:hypothetical protein